MNDFPQHFRANVARWIFKWHQIPSKDLVRVHVAGIHLIELPLRQMRIPKRCFRTAADFQPNALDPTIDVLLSYINAITYCYRRQGVDLRQELLRSKYSNRIKRLVLFPSLQQLSNFGIVGAPSHMARMNAPRRNFRDASPAPSMHMRIISLINLTH